MKMRRPLQLGKEGFEISDWGRLGSKKNSGGIILVEVILAGAFKCLFADKDGRPMAIGLFWGPVLPE